MLHIPEYVTWSNMQHMENKSNHAGFTDNAVRTKKELAFK